MTTKGEIKRAEILIQSVEHSFGLNVGDLKTKTRQRTILRIRQCVQSLLTKHSKLSLTVIAALFNQTHATVLNSKKEIGIGLEMNYMDIVDVYKKIEETIIAIGAIDYEVICQY